ncbi:hypothetical protein FSP39_016575, partial [Pinctada imbricata]
SCEDKFIGGSMKNGTYQIYNRKNQAYFVYCEFYNNYGYTYVSRTTNVEINIDDLYTTRDHVKIRIQRNDRTQAETTVENLARYKTQYPLTFFYNRNNGFATPINHAALGPYLYLGFLPVSAANHVQPQGYRAGSRDFPFNNCDRNPNSYIAFFFDTNSHKEVAYSNTDYPLMHGWINVARDIPTSSDMPDEFYFLYEMHMGGCGGYAVAHQHDNLLGAALGFRFDVKDPCENNPCQNGGTCLSVTETSYDCECTQGHLGKRCEFDSCKDIFIGGNTKNGTYQIYNRKNQAYFVYCEFHNNYGYTYVSRTTTVGINIDDLYSTREHAKIRIQKNDRTQAETTVENLARYKTQYPLTFFYNRNNGFATPINHAALGPYLYLGFLPVSAANHVQPQGYRAGGRDFPFNNCDHNPNSYIAFFFNPNSHKEAAYSNINVDWPLMHGWINVAKNIPTSSHMSDDYYFLYEMHMGGCGGYAVAHHHDNVLGAALGLRFDVKDPCKNNPCQNGGTCFSVTETSYDCECTQGHLGKRCEFG